MTLKVGTQEQIVDMFNKMDRSVKNLLKNVIQLVFFMEGSVQYDDMLRRTPLERSLMEEFTMERLEAKTKALKGK